MKLTNLRLTFSEDLSELCEEMNPLIQGLSENSLKELFRIFHQIKGSAMSLNFPQLGAMMHEMEDYLKAIQDGQLYPDPRTRELLKAILDLIESQAKLMKLNKTLPQAPEALRVELKTIVEKVAAGWKHAASKKPDTSPSDLRSGVSKTSSSVRIANEKLDHIQQNLKRILQIRNQLSAFANRLQNEFSDEAFPRDLVQLIDELSNEASDLMEFFISLRIIPVSSLNSLADCIIQQTSDQLGKPARLEFNSDPHLEIDQSVYQCLELSLTQIIKNSIDHGLESVELRESLQKDPLGAIKIVITPKDADHIRCEVSDDGQGISREAIIQAILAKGIMDETSIRALGPESIDDLIFVDGLSSKQEITDISGRGVGMGAVKESIKKLNGSIAVRSELGKGTHFTIILPRIFRL